MKDIDEIVASALKELGVDTTKPARWLPHIHRARDQTTGAIVREYPDGYTCSHCGKHSHYQKAKCDGCSSIMQRAKE